MCYQVSGYRTQFIEASTGETIVLEYRLNATHAYWKGPAHNNKEIRSQTVINALDRFGENKTWNVMQYSSDARLRNSLPHIDRLNIAGIDSKGEFYLEIRNVSVDDAGLYLCEIQMPNKSFATRSFIVHLKYIPDLLITFEPPMPVYEGSSLSLCCLSNNRYPKETISWFNTKVGRQYRPHPSTACVHCVKTSRNDSGIYTCKAEYEGQKVTDNFTLNVLHIPDLFITFEPPMPIYEGSSLRLCCISNNSLANATIGWSNTKICRQDRQNPSTVCLHFVKTNRNDSGIYTCKAEQKGKKLTANITLDVLRTFRDTINIQADEVINADSAHFIDIIDVNNVLTISQENNSQTNETNDIDAENIGIAQMLEEQNSFLSNSSSDTTEHLNSGYEHPYTTMVANNGDEDEHIYDFSKQNSAIKNIFPSRNDASEPFVEIIEQDSSSDNIRTHFYANEVPEN
ncbi:Hypothetical predicted protein [Mytilus galloprovincialis]|uniref:Ig-like domain-containing protein n=1 Tax=Mytilus galloprovincialis TaxID=29158 RepID=A0A8B6E788_MYTGA|nr:Hypothetical predicted protein [Mytilus galloprovincialis]